MVFFALQVGSIISVIDMPLVDESLWWRGKQGFEVYLQINSLSFPFAHYLAEITSETEPFYEFVPMKWFWSYEIKNIGIVLSGLFTTFFVILFSHFTCIATY